MRVIFYMSRPVLTTTPDTDFHLVFEQMRVRRIHHVPVMDGDKIVGIAAERDLLLAAANFGSAEVPVSMVMKKPVVSVSDRAHLKQAARLLVENRIGSLPVVNARQQLVGIITQTDIFKITAGMLHARTEDGKAPAKAAKAAKAAKPGTASPKAAAKKAAPAKSAPQPAATKGKAAAKAAQKPAAPRKPKAAAQPPAKAATKAAPPVKAARTSAKGTAKPAKAAKPAVPAKAKRAAR